VDTLPTGSLNTSKSDISDVGEGEGECQSQEDSDSEYNSATDVDTTETETDGEGCAPSKYNQYVLIACVMRYSKKLCILLRIICQLTCTCIFVAGYQRREQICVQNPSILYSCPSCFSHPSFAMCAKLITQWLKLVVLEHKQPSKLHVAIQHVERNKPGIVSP